MPSRETRVIRVQGQVQGVGFRPFVYRLANALKLTGEVLNRSSDVTITLQGPARDLDEFLKKLVLQAPGVIQGIKKAVITSPSLHGFCIAPSSIDSGIADVLLTDKAICQDCLQEFNDPASRRYRYPFISCTHCGPRFSICQSLPYDRENTAWRNFPLCNDCQAEVTDPDNRRFHQVGIGCPQCGPAVTTLQGIEGDAAFDQAAETLLRSGVLAFKGDTGFQLMVDATNSEAVEKLRQRKRRTKPLAVLAHSLEWIRQHASIDSTEEKLLQDPESPLLLLQSRSNIAENVAPGTDMLAVMLPHSALQLRLSQQLQRPLVATSGNLSGSPLLYKNDEALQALTEVADCFLLHDLELCQGLDDSIIRVMAGRPVTLRLGRGLAPHVQPLRTSGTSLGCGAHLKSSIALHGQDRLIAGPYIGDLDSVQARQRYREQKSRLPEFFHLKDGQEITDLHPDYGSSIDADYRAHAVPHHVAHAMAVWQEHQVQPPFLVLTWDGIGLGPDRTIWGGECLLFESGYTWRRVGSVRPFMLPQADDIARHPGRIAGILSGTACAPGGVNCSSMGRLIEGMASLAGLRDDSDYEAQVAMEWEALGWQADQAAPMQFKLDADNNLDWRPLLPVIADSSISLSARSAGFHQALAQAAVRQCRQAGFSTVLLSGGVFQNRLLVESLVTAASKSGLNVLTHRQIPPNDGGIALGQCVAKAMNVDQYRQEAQQCA